MKPPILVVLLSLAMSSLACGFFSAPDLKPPSVAAPTVQPVATQEPALPTKAPTQESQVQATATLPSAAVLPTLVPPLDTNGDGRIDICEVIPQSVLEETLGRKLIGPGLPFTDPSMGDGCAFDFGKDSSEAYFVYVAIGTEKQFTDALANAVKAEPVKTLGDSAFLHYGPDARQLWARIGKKAVLVAIGDRENVAAEMILARYLVDFAAAPAKVTATSFAGSWHAVDPNPIDKNKNPLYCQVDISLQGDKLSLKFASICKPLTYSEFLSTTVTFTDNPVVFKLKDIQDGEFTITLTLTGDILTITTVYVDKDGNPGVNKSDNYSR
jgi:hypothetical protein